VRLVLWLAVLALCGVQIAHTRFVADLSSFLPASPAPEQRFLIEQLQSGALARTMLIGIEGADRATRATLSRGLAARLRADGRFASVANGGTGGFEAERQFLFEHRYILSPKVSRQRFEPRGLEAAIGETIDLLASPLGLFVKPLVPRDPTGETVALVTELQRSGGPPLEAGVWASGSRALLVALTRAGAADIDGQREAIERVEQLFEAEKMRTGAAASGARVVMTGAGVFSARSRALIEHEVTRLTIASAALVLGLLLFVYRSGVAILLGLVPVVTGAIVGIAAVSLGFGVVHGITLGFGTTLIGEAVDYAIYLFIQAGQGGAQAESWLARFWPTIRLGVLTSIAGFLALLFSGVPGLAQLGLYSICGLAAAAIVTRFLLPGLMPASFRIRDLSAVGSWLERGCRQLARGRMLVPGLAIAAAAVLVLKPGPLWDSELASLNPISAADRALDAELRAALGASDARFVVAARAASLQGALEQAERIAAALDPLVADGVLGGYDSPARLLPSEATQRARIASLPDAAILRERLGQAVKTLPISAAKLEPFVEDVGRARSMPLLERESLASTAFAAALDGMLHAAPDGTWTAVVALRPAAGASTIDASRVRASLAGVGGGKLFIDLKVEIDSLYRAYFERAIVVSGIGFVAIVLLLAAALRDRMRVARVMLPLAAGVMVVAAGHALARVPLTLMHLIGLLLVVAIGSNYALFFDRLPPYGDPAAHRTLASLATANATTVAAFGVLAFSTIPVLHAIGSTVAAGAFVTLAFAAALSARYNRTGEEK